MSVLEFVVEYLFNGYKITLEKNKCDLYRETIETIFNQNEKEIYYFYNYDDKTKVYVGAGGPIYMPNYTYLYLNKQHKIKILKQSSLSNYNTINTLTSHKLINDDDISLPSINDDGDDCHFPSINNDDDISIPSINDDDCHFPSINNDDDDISLPSIPTNKKDNHSIISITNDDDYNHNISSYTYHKTMKSNIDCAPLNISIPQHNYTNYKKVFYKPKPGAAVGTNTAFIKDGEQWYYSYEPISK